MFYLTRIDQGRGEYSANVESLLQAPGVGAALIELTGSRDERIGRRASGLLRQLHHSLGLRNTPQLPQSKDEWLSGWKEVGSRLPVRELLSNFGSQFP